MDELRVLTGDFVNVVISNSSSDSALCLERRFRKDITVEELKVGMSCVHAFLGLGTTLRLGLFCFASLKS